MNSHYMLGWLSLGFLLTAFGLVSIFLLAMGIALIAADVALAQLSFLDLPEWLFDLGTISGISGFLIFSMFTGLSWSAVLFLQRRRGKAREGQQGSSKVLSLLASSYPGSTMLLTERA